MTHQTCSTLNLTVFPQSPGMAATFNTTLEMLKGDVIGRELRAIALAQVPDFNRFLGLSCFSPMINVIRDPMWGRNSEAYSECPYLTGQFAHAVIRGKSSVLVGFPVAAILRGAVRLADRAALACGDVISRGSDVDVLSIWTRPA